MPYFHNQDKIGFYFEYYTQDYSCPKHYYERGNKNSHRIAKFKATLDKKKIECKINSKRKKFIKYECIRISDNLSCYIDFSIYLY